MNELFSPAGLASWVIWKVLVIKMDDTTVAMLRKSFKWVFDKGPPVLPHSLLLTKGWPVREFEGQKEKSQGTSTAYPNVQVLPFLMSNLMIAVSTKMPAYQNVREIRLRSGKNQGRWKLKKGTTLDDGVSQFSFVVLSEINYNNEKVIWTQAKWGIFSW